MHMATALVSPNRGQRLSCMAAHPNVPTIGADHRVNCCWMAMGRIILVVFPMLVTGDDWDISSLIGWKYNRYSVLFT